MRLVICCLVLLLQAGLADAEPALKIYGMESRPVSFMDGNAPSGLAVELARQVQARLGSHEDIEILPWARASTLAEVAPNVLLLSIVRTPEREHRLQFVGPIFSSRVTAFALKDRLVALRRQHDDFHALHAGARRGSIFVDLPRALGYNITDETNTSDTGGRMLMNRRFDLWFDGEELMANAVEQAGYRMSDVDVAFRLGNVGVYFAFSSGTPQATVDAWAAALHDMKRDGSFLAIHRRWLPAHQLPPDVAP